MSPGARQTVDPTSDVGRRETDAPAARAADAGDVATAIEYARSNDIEIAVRSGGHSGHRLESLALRGARVQGDRVYANFLEDDGEARIRVAYPGVTYDRLVAIKRRYDPANVFHRNQNIRLA